MWRSSSCRLKPTGEGSGTHRRSGGQIFNRQWLIEVDLHPGHCVGKAIAVVEAGKRPVDVLGLPSVALRRDDQLASKLCRHFAPIVLTDDMEAQIDACRTSSSGEDVSLIDEENAGIHRQIRIAGRQCVALCPVRGNSPSVEQPSFGQHKGSPAKGKHSTSPGVGLSEPLEHAVGNV